MQVSNQLEQINQLISEIKWPLNSDVYLSFSGYPLKNDYSISLYVSNKSKGSYGHTADSFGEYFCFVHESLADLIVELQKYKGAQS